MPDLKIWMHVTVDYVLQYLYPVLELKCTIGFYSAMVLSTLLQRQAINSSSEPDFKFQ
jgi:hypothetical protein